MNNKTSPWPIVLSVLITALVVGGGMYYWQTLDSTEVTPIDEETTEPEVEEEEVEPEFGSLLYEKENYSLPFGSAEVEGYYTTVEKATSLDNSTPTVTCSAFVVTDGPSLLLDALTAERFGTPPTVVIGSEDSVWRDINTSTKENPVKIFVTMNPTFEGALIGCMPWPFTSIIELTITGDYSPGTPPEDLEMEATGDTSDLDPYQ